MYENASLKDLGNIRTHSPWSPKLHPDIIRRPFQFPDKLRPLHFLQRQIKGRGTRPRQRNMHFPPSKGFAASTSRRKCIGRRSTFAAQSIFLMRHRMHLVALPHRNPCIPAFEAVQMRVGPSKAPWFPPIGVPGRSRPFRCRPLPFTRTMPFPSRRSRPRGFHGRVR